MVSVWFYICTIKNIYIVHTLIFIYYLLCFFFILVGVAAGRWWRGGGGGLWERSRSRQWRVQGHHVQSCGAAHTQQLKKSARWVLTTSYCGMVNFLAFSCNVSSRGVFVWDGQHSDDTQVNAQFIQNAEYSQIRCLTSPLFSALAIITNHLIM